VANKGLEQGRVSTSANFYQNDCCPNGGGLSLNGILVDLDDISDNVGGWYAAMISVVANKNSSTIIHLAINSYENTCSGYALHSG
jgi:hypothetical protein